MLHENKAYTLIELTVVVFLIGIMLALAVPRVQYGMWSDDLKTATRRMVGTVKTLRNDAVREHKEYRLHFDMESNRFWVEWNQMTASERTDVRQNSSRLPGSVRVLDVFRPGIGKENVGDVVIHFSKKGYVEESVIHLGSDDGRAHTIVLSPFLGAIKTYDTYVDIEGT